MSRHLSPSHRSATGFTLIEMALAGHCGIDIELSGWADNMLRALFNEELGGIVQIRQADRDAFQALLDKHGLRRISARVGEPSSQMKVKLRHDNEKVASWTWSELMSAWSETSHAMQRRRDNPESADAELAWRVDATDPGISPRLGNSSSMNITPNGSSFLGMWRVKKSVAC